MTLKMIALGILALLGLSSVINPKAFRVFLGGISVLCLAMFLGVIAIADNPPNAKQPANVVNKLVSYVLAALGQQPHWEDVANSTVDAVESDVSKAKDRNLEALANKGIKFKAARVTETMRSMTKAERLHAIFEIYLEDEFKPKNKGPGIDRLTPKDLDPSLLKPVPIRQLPNGKWLYVVGFVEDEFAREARRSGRKIVMLERLEGTAIVVGGIGALLFILYGILKVVNSRDRTTSESDRLAVSKISMV